MKILKIRFRNLNSLQGEWEIDFTHAAYQSLFAIIGETGAGKTTILDAICLGLYGRTPRLDRINKGAGNEILSRTAEEQICFSEVTFETAKGRYRCRWEQQRAHRKIEGKLQDYAWEIVNDKDGGKVLASKSKVEGKVAEVTGLSFDQFTRSMMLAQGEFANFLKAKGSERADILEQITGTEIYGYISKRTHERYTDEKKKMDSLSEQCGLIMPLSDEDEAKLQSDLATKQQESIAHEARRKEAQDLIGWLDRLTKLATDLAGNARDLDALSQEETEFAPEGARLALALKAQEAEPARAELDTLKTAQTALQVALETDTAALPAAEQQVQSSAAAKGNADAAVASAQKAKTAAEPTLQEVRRLDTLLSEKQKSIDAANQEKTTAAAKQAKILANQKTNQTESARVEALHAAAENYLANHLADANLPTNIGSLRLRFEDAENAQTEQSKKTTELADCHEEWSKRKRVVATKDAALKTALTRREEAKTAFDNLAAKRDELQKTGDAKTLRTQKETLQKERPKLEKISEKIENIAKAETGLSAEKQSEETLLAAQKQFATDIEKKTHAVAAAEKAVSNLEAKRDEAKKIHDFDALRHELHDGHPCPLCGSLSHPFLKEKQADGFQKAETALAEKKRELKALESELNKLKIDSGKNDATLHAAQKTINNLEPHLANLRQTLKTECEALGLTSDFKTLDKTLKERLSDAETKITNIENTLGKLEEVDADHAEAKENWEEAKEAHLAADSAYKTAQAAEAECGRAHARLTDEQKNAAVRFDALLSQLALDLAAYGVECTTVADLTTAEKTLTARSTEWTNQTLARDTHARHLGELRVEHAGLEKQAEEAAADLSKTQTQWQALVAEQKTLREERSALFGAKDPATESQRLADDVAEAEKSRKTAEEVSAEAAKKLTELNTRIEQTSRQMQETKSMIAAKTDAFTAHLQELGFADEKAFASACLPQESRSALAERSGELKKRRQSLETLQKTALAEQEKEKAKALTEQPREAVQATLAEAVSAAAAAQQEVGSLRNQIAENNRKKSESTNLRAAYDKQQAVVAPWADLEGLIGSESGKKFRTYAQGLTFDKMIEYANIQLRKMSDRYELCRDKNASSTDKSYEAQLGLNIMDKFQANEVRPTDNLSGGESFLVSMALALGLSQMASANVRIDSLFLDEGFGTLDGETLDSAITVLASLHQEGKLIGVISHVEALKERIATRILVEKKGGGCSALSGPGCRAISD